MVTSPVPHMLAPFFVSYSGFFTFLCFSVFFFSLALFFHLCLVSPLCLLCRSVFLSLILSTILLSFSLFFVSLFIFSFSVVVFLSVLASFVLLAWFSRCLSVFLSRFLFAVPPCHLITFSISRSLFRLLFQLLCLYPIPCYCIRSLFRSLFSCIFFLCRPRCLSRSLYIPMYWSILLSAFRSPCLFLVVPYSRFFLLCFFLWLFRSYSSPAILYCRSLVLCCCLSLSLAALLSFVSVIPLSRFLPFVLSCFPNKFRCSLLVLCVASLSVLSFFMPSS